MLTVTITRNLRRIDRKTSLCYDLEKWTMISLEMVALSLTVGLVLVNFAHGQNYVFDPLLTKCVVH